MAELLPSEELVDEASDFGHLKPGTRLGRYELLVPVARGGMARVWAARLTGQRGFQKLVAIKTILPHLASEPEFERMFLDEARIASGVHHPNVCEIYELGEESRTLYLVMEWVSGDSFSRVLRPTGRNEAIEPRVVARVIADACAGLHVAHEMTSDDGRPMNVVHRDLSPHNILVTSDGTAKVCDFGVAKALGQLHEATSAGQLKGKVAYMAPEQVTGSAVDRRSDVFSLGVVLYEATTGMRPFRGEGEAQVMHQVLQGEFEPPSRIIRSYPQELERIVSRALSPQPILRYPTAERMRFALEEFLAKGQLVTQSNVAQLVRARIGESLEKRKERIRQASSAGDGAPGFTGVSDAPGASMTPSNQNQAHEAHRSGVKQAGARPLFTTLQIGRPPGAPGTEPPPPMAAAASSATIPQAEPASANAQPGSLSSTIAMPMAPVAIPPAPPPFAMPGYTPVPAHAMQPLPPGATMPPISNAPISHPHIYFEAQPQERPPAGAGSYALAAAIGVLLAAVIGGGGYWAWHRRHAEPPPLVTQPAIAAQPPMTPGQPTAASQDIVFRITPPEATLTVDGIELLPGSRAVPRPAAGRTVTVVVHAKGFEDTTVLVDYFTTSPMDIPLKPVGGAPTTIELGDTPPTPPNTPSAQNAAPAPVAQPDKPPESKAKPKREPGLPANPY